MALFNASDDTIDMVQTLLGNQSLVWCHFADLKKGIVDFEKFLIKHNPQVVIFDISPPYEENWRFFETMRDADAMRGRGAVLTTTNKSRLDEVLGADCHALEIVGKPEDLQQIRAAITAATPGRQSGSRRSASPLTPDPGPPSTAVALFNSSDDTVEMVQRMLSASGIGSLAGCHFAALKKGPGDFARLLAEHDPRVVIFDISPPYAENWAFYQTLSAGRAMEGRGLVLTAPTQNHL